ncbi:MAG TPA: DUF6159 family protein [Kofleriaceae bacterium]|nr:DUF6159 family protein [Kofleriaceae bacterium]
MGFIDSLQKGWGFLKAAFRMAGENKRLLLPSLYQVLISITYFIALVMLLIAVDPRWSNGTWAVFGIVATFVSFLIFYFFNGVTVNMIDVHLKGGAPSLKEGMADAGKNIVAIMWLSLVSTIVDLFARAARDNDSIVGKIIAGIVEAVWTTLSFLLLPAIIIEDAGFGQAMRRVRDLHKGHMLLVGVGEVGVRGITGLIGLVWFLVTFGVVYVALDTIGGNAGLVIAIVGGGTLFALFVAFSTYVRMAYYTCLYLWAADVEAKGQDAPAPLPLAIALGHSTVGRRAA